MSPSNEPVAIGAAVIAFFNSVLFVVSLVTSISADVIGGLNLVVVAAVGLVASIVRSRVTPVGE